MFGPLIFRQIQKYQRRRPKQVAAPPSRQPVRKVQNQTQNKTQHPIEEEYYEEDIPDEADFVDPINN